LDAGEPECERIIELTRGNPRRVPALRHRVALGATAEIPANCHEPLLGSRAVFFDLAVVQYVSDVVAVMTTFENSG